jgi:hypothetical protein
MRRDSLVIIPTRVAKFRSVMIVAVEVVTLRNVEDVATDLLSTRPSMDNENKRKKLVHAIH